MKYLTPFLEKNTDSYSVLPTKPTKPGVSGELFQRSTSNAPTKPTKPKSLLVPKWRDLQETALQIFLAEHPKQFTSPADVEELREYFQELPAPGVACDRCMPIKACSSSRYDCNQPQEITTS